MISNTKLKHSNKNRWKVPTEGSIEIKPWRNNSGYISSVTQSVYRCVVSRERYKTINGTIKEECR